MLHRSPGFAVPPRRSAWFCVAAVCLATPLAGVLADERKSDSSGPELIDPFVAADAFAGQTVTDGEMGRKLMQARGKKVPRVGQIAPDFNLRSPDGKQSTRLSSFRGKKPVVLIFGSHT
jgi:hypothetical protein